MSVPTRAAQREREERPFIWPYDAAPSHDADDPTLFDALVFASAKRIAAHNMTPENYVEWLRVQRPPCPAIFDYALTLAGAQLLWDHPEVIEVFRERFYSGIRNKSRALTTLSPGAWVDDFVRQMLRDAGEPENAIAGR